MTWFWGLLAAGALLWPDRISGPFDGVPLDRAAEAVLVGRRLSGAVVASSAIPSNRVRARLHRPAGRLEALLGPAVRAGRLVRAVRAGAAVRQGRRPARRTHGTCAPTGEHPIRVCSAIMTRSYGDFAEFPAWFFNLPPPNDSWPEPADRPPGATSRCASAGSSRARAPACCSSTRTASVATSRERSTVQPSAGQQRSSRRHRTSSRSTPS